MVLGKATSSNTGELSSRIAISSNIQVESATAASERVTGANWFRAFHVPLCPKSVPAILQIHHPHAVCLHTAVLRLVPAAQEKSS